MDRLTEIDILVCQICADIYRKSFENKLTDDEGKYYISSIARNLCGGLEHDLHRELRKKLEKQDGTDK